MATAATPSPSDSSAAPLSVDDFAGRIKAKYPEYGDMDNADLTRRIVAKYPEYKGQVVDPDLSTSKTTPPPPQSAGGFRGMVKAAQDRIDAQVAPNPNATGITGAIDEFGKGTAAQLLGPIVHPVDTAIAMGKALMAGGGGVGHPLTAMTGNKAVDDANDAARAGVQAETAQQGKQMFDQAKTDPYYAAGNIIGAAAVTHGITKGLPEIPIVKAATRGAKGVGESLRTSVQDSFSGNAPEKAIQKFGDQMADIHSDESVNAERGAHQQAIQDKSVELDAKVQKAQAGAKANNDALWNKVREKTAGKTVPTDSLREAAAVGSTLADPADSAIFRSLSQEAPDNPPVTTEDGVFRPGDPGYEDEYESTYGVPPPPAGDSVDFNQLHRWYNYVGEKMYGSRQLPAGTYQGLDAVRKALDRSMRLVADQSDARADLKAARASHSQMKEAFSDSPNQQATNASKTLQEQSPEFQKEKGQNERLSRVAAYDPSITDTANELKTHRQALDNLSKPGTTPEPAAPDIQQQTRDALDKNIKKYGRVGEWVARLALGGALLHGPGPFASELALGQLGLTVLSRAVRSESVLDWLAKPTAETLRQIDKLPPADAAKLKMGLTALAQDELNRNPAKASVTINPSVAAWLGATPRPLSVKEMRDRIPKK